MLEHNKYVIKERVKIISAVQSYDILDPESGQPIGLAEEKIGVFTQLLRWVMSKQFLPTRLEVREKPDDSLVFGKLSAPRYVHTSRGADDSQRRAA